jgi:ech hydrogenase subunit A
LASWYVFLLAAIILPILAGLACYLIPGASVRRGLVILAAVALIVSALWLHFKVSLEPMVISLAWADKIVFAADLAILAYIAFVAWERRHFYLLALALLQAVGLLLIELVFRPDTSAIPSLAIDRLSVVMYLVVSIVGSLISLYALRYMEEHEEHTGPGRSGRFFLWFILFLGVMNGLVLSNNLLWLYLFWEATTLCSFQLIGHEDTEESRANAMRALFINSAGGLALILGIALLVKTFGGAALSLIGIINAGLAITSTTFMIALGLLVLGGFTKAAQFPFQSWLLGAMVAPTPVSALLHSSTMVKAGVYLVLRLAPAYSGMLLSSAITLFGVFTFFSASLLAVREDNAKLVLAYSTIANLGLIIACGGLNTPLAINAAVLLIIFHAVSKALLFMSVGVIEHRLGSRNIESMEGLAVKMPAMTVLMCVGAFSMFLPPFGMLFSKWAALEASLREPFLVFLFIAASTLTALFWTKWLGRILTTVPGERLKEEPYAMSGFYVVSLGVLALSAVILSFGLGAVVNHLTVPATITWYPPAIQNLSGLNLASFPWVSYFNPEILVGNQIYPEGNFPVGLLFGALLLMFVVPAILFRPRQESLGGIYLSGENIDEPEATSFLATMEEPSALSLGGYYFKRSLGDKLDVILNVIALGILILMMGVVLL